MFLNILIELQFQTEDIKLHLRLQQRYKYFIILIISKTYTAFKNICGTSLSHHYHMGISQSLQDSQF